MTKANKDTNPETWEEFKLLEFANFYQQFMMNFSWIATPLISLL